MNSFRIKLIRSLGRAEKLKLAYYSTEMNQLGSDFGPAVLIGKSALHFVIKRVRKEPEKHEKGRRG